MLTLPCHVYVITILLLKPMTQVMDHLPNLHGFFRRKMIGCTSISAYINLHLEHDQSQKVFQELIHPATY